DYRLISALAALLIDERSQAAGDIQQPLGRVDSRVVRGEQEVTVGEPATGPQQIDDLAEVVSSTSETVDCDHQEFAGKGAGQQFRIRVGEPADGVHGPQNLVGLSGSDEEQSEE